MSLSRTHILVGVAVLLLGVILWNWISGWGLITVDFKDAPLSTVLKKIERQGGVRIVTNADPTTKMTLQLDHVSLAEAMNTVSARLDGSSRLAYVAAPTKAQIEQVFNDFTQNTNPSGWKVYFSGGRFGGDFGGEEMIGPKELEWKVSDTPEKGLQGFLDQGSQKTGAFFAAPEDWNPTLASFPATNSVRKVTYSAVSQAKGKVVEAVFVMVRPPRDDTADNNNRGGYNYPGAMQMRGGGFNPRGRGGNPEWMADRMNAQIAALPAEDQAEAKALFAKFQAAMALPEDQRREKMRELFQDPQMQEMMEKRMEARDAKRTPEQRQQRYQRYIERKNQMKASGS